MAVTRPLAHLSGWRPPSPPAPRRRASSPRRAARGRELRRVLRPRSPSRPPTSSREETHRDEPALADHRRQVRARRAPLPRDRPGRRRALRRGSRRDPRAARPGDGRRRGRLQELAQRRGEAPPGAHRLRRRDPGERRAARATLTQEQGKPLAQRDGGDLRLRGLVPLHRRARDPRRGRCSDDEKGRIEVRRRPLGVVAAITPWNFPVLLRSWKIAPALLAGNTVVLKPSPFTPLATLKLGEILRDVVPPGVLNVDLGRRPARRAGSPAHPAVRKISFTGSVATGKKVAAAAAPDLKRVTLELGGNDAAIVLDDVDPKAIAPKLFWGAFTNSGQVCSAIKRLYVPEALYEPIAAELADAREGRQGRRRPRRRERARADQQQAAVRARARARRGREGGGRPDPRRRRAGRPGNGYFYPPTIVADLDDGDAPRRRGAVRPGAADHPLPRASTTRSSARTRPTSASRARSGRRTSERATRGRRPSSSAARPG